MEPWFGRAAFHHRPNFFMARKNGSRWNAPPPAWYTVPRREAGIVAAFHELPVDAERPPMFFSFRGRSEYAGIPHSFTVPRSKAEIVAASHEPSREGRAGHPCRAAMREGDIRSRARLNEDVSPHLPKVQGKARNSMRGENSLPVSGSTKESHPQKLRVAPALPQGGVSLHLRLPAYHCPQLFQSQFSWGDSSEAHLVRRAISNRSEREALRNGKC